jgi:hypothetical protein
MTDRELPSWAIRLRDERVRRLWSQKVTAVRMRDAADEQTRAALPGIESIQRYVRAYEAGQHVPGDLYAELYCRIFGLPRAAIFGDLPGGPQAAARTERLPTAERCPQPARMPRYSSATCTVTMPPRRTGRPLSYAADEAGTSPAVALSVRAKTERWRMRFASSAELARQGYDCSPATPIRILLASQEANAAALLGDLRRARAALLRAEHVGEVIRPDSGVSAWSCPPPHQALFALSVAIRAQDADGALAQATTADAAWASGAARVTGTWAQVRLGAAIARIMMADLDGALAEITPVMTLAPEFRMATITGYTRQIDQRLRQRRFLRDGTAIAIRSQIRDFHAAAAGQPVPGSE